MTFDGAKQVESRQVKEWLEEKAAAQWSPPPGPTAPAPCIIPSAARLPWAPEEIH